MIKTGKVLLISFASVSLAALSACGGGGSTEKQETAAADTAAANTAETADAAAGNATGGAAPAGAPAPDDVATLSGATFAQFTGNAAEGEKVFVQCKTCHVTEEGVNRIGPSLHNIVGRKAGTVAGYSYSPANANSGITWSKEKLFQYLENPQRVVPGTKMAFAGIKDDQKRADLIEWLATQ